MDSYLVAMDRHWWSVYMNAKTLDINTDGFSEIKKNISELPF